MKKKTENLLVKELEEIEAFGLIKSYKHLQDKISFLVHDIQKDFPEESQQLIEIADLLDDLIKLPPNAESDDNLSKLKNDVALVIKQLLEIED